MVLTSTMIREDQSNGLNQKLLGYNAALKELAASKGCLLADLNTRMQDKLKTFPEDAPKGKQLTRDGVHMNAYGNIMMASGVLAAFGLSQEELAACEAAWKSAPNTMSIRLQVGMSIADYEAIQNKTGQSPETVFARFLEEKKAELLPGKK